MSLFIKQYHKSKLKLDAATSKNIFHLMFTGLGEDPSSDCLGLRPQAEQFKQSYPTSDYAIYSWDSDGMSEADSIQLCQQLFALYQAGNGSPYDTFIIRGHSFGGALAVYFTNWLSQNYKSVKVDLLILLDPVPNQTSPVSSWSIPMNTITQAIQFTQQNGGYWWLLFPRGTPVNDPLNSGRLTSIDCTPWTPNVYHSEMVSDSRVWAIEWNYLQACATPNAS